MIIRETSIILLILSLPALPAFSQVQLGGFVEYDNITYVKNEHEEKVNGRNQGILQLELRHKAGPDAEVFASIEIRNDQADPSRDRVYLDEAYLNLYTGNFDFRIGKQIYAWGRADGFNPTDNLTAWDYTDVLDTDDEKLGVASARLTWYFNDWSVEAVLVPSFTASVLPGPSSRWWPEMPARVVNPLYPLVGAASLPARYTYLDPVLPDESPGSVQYAARISGTARGWDLSVNWFDGFDDLPALHTRTDIDSAFSGAHILVEPRYHHRRAIGADFSSAFGSLGVRGEGAYYLTEDWEGTDPAIDDPYLQLVVGLDYTFRDVLPDKNLFALVQWVQEKQMPDRHTSYRITDLNHLLRKSMLGRTELSWGEFVKLKCEGVVNFDTDDWWVQPGLEWSVTDGVQVWALADLLGGPGDSFFGMFRDNRRVHVRMKYSF